MDLINEKNYLSLTGNDFPYNALEPFFEFPFVFGPGNKGSHVQGINLLAFERIGDIAGYNTLGNAFCNGRFSHSRFTHQNGIIFCTSAQDLEHTTDLLVTSNNRIEFAFTGLIVKVHCVFIECIESLTVCFRIYAATLTKSFDGFF